MDFFNGFFSQIGYFSSVLIFITVFFNGATDASNAVATCVGTKCMKISHATIMSAVFNFLGVLIMGTFAGKVAFTVKELAVFPSESSVKTAVCASMLSVIIWAGGAWLFGIPTSESHALTASLTGTALACGGAYINTAQYARVLYGLLVSSALGFAVGVIISLLTDIFLKKCSDTFFRYAQIFGACCTSFAHGGQDGVKFLGLFLLFTNGGEVGTPIIFAVSAVMLFGTAVGGKKIIKSVGENMVEINKKDGFASDIASALCLLFASIMGIPASTTQTKTSSILGVGALSSGKINAKTTLSIVTAWIFTFPACTLLGYMIMKIMIKW